MESLLHLDLTQIITTIGYLGVFTIVFAESIAADGRAAGCRPP